MGPISGIGGGAQYQPLNIRPAAGTGAESSRATTGAGVLGSGTSGGVGSAQGVVDVYTAVAEMLQSVGGGVENDKLLRMLIMLMILLAMFENQQDQVAVADRANALQTLSAGSGSGAQTIGIYSTSTTISIQQTQTAVVTTDPFSGGGGPTPDSGQTLDVVA